MRVRQVALGVACALFAGAATAEERYDHRGSVGLTVASGGEALTSGVVGGATDNGLRVPTELGGTISITDHTEARLAARLTFLGQALVTSATLGIRNSFGYAQLKTFFDLDFAAHFTPSWFLGAHVAVGLQYDLLPVLGVYTALGAQLGGGSGLRLSFELMLGLQFRTYWLE